MSNTLTIQSLNVLHLRSVDLTVSGATCLCISGRSGGGKSTLLKAVADLIPHEGSILLNGVACSQIDPPLWRQQVGLLAAESYFWFDSVGPHFDNVESQWFAHLGFEMDVMNWSIDRLSSGEKQRLALLRMLCNHPKVLLLDEPCANLDGHTSILVESLVQQYSQQHRAPVLWVSHDLEQISRMANQHYVLNENFLQEVAV